MTGAAAGVPGGGPSDARATAGVPGGVLSDARTTVGVLGGGQLARMMAIAGAPLGVRLRVLESQPDAPAAAFAEQVVGELDDPAALAALADGVECVTLETENLPPDAMPALRARGVELRPGVESWRTCADRLLEKQFLNRNGIPTAEFRAADSDDDVRRAFDELGPAIAKTRTQGYDGKGQLRLDAGNAGDAWTSLDRRPLVVERVVPFRRELSLVCVRSLDGDIAHYPLVENVHRDGILRVTTAPAPDVDDATAAAAVRYAEMILNGLGHVGVLAIELFDTGAGLLVNELAPRVHNSGHWTIEGAACSQFENHLRAILGMPLGPTHATAQAIMVNLIGEVPPADVLRADPDAHVHLYGKEPRPGRKLGHVTFIGTDAARLAARAAPLAAL